MSKVVEVVEEQASTLLVIQCYFNCYCIHMIYCDNTAEQQTL